MKKTNNQPTRAESARVLKALPRTADGKVMYPGMPVWTIETRDAGKSWTAKGLPAAIAAVSNLGKAVMRHGSKLWESTRPPADNRLFSARAAALAECRRRNANKTTDGLTILKNRYPKAWKRTGAK